MTSSEFKPWKRCAVGCLAASGNSKEASPAAVVARQTTVPERRCAPNFSQTNRYSPPCVASVRPTTTSGKLHATFVACSPRPERRTIRSGVSPTHQLGGSTFLTAGAFGADSACGAASKRKRSPERIAGSAAAIFNQRRDQRFMFKEE